MRTGQVFAVDILDICQIVTGIRRNSVGANRMYKAETPVGLQCERHIIGVRGEKGTTTKSLTRRQGPWMHDRTVEKKCRQFATRISMCNTSPIRPSRNRPNPEGSVVTSFASELIEAWQFTDCLFFSKPMIGKLWTWLGRGQKHVQIKREKKAIRTKV